eukprot:sb/3467443/
MTSPDQHQVVQPPKMIREVDITTTWGFPSDINPDSVLFLGRDDYARTVYSDNHKRRAVTCRMGGKGTGGVMVSKRWSEECYGKIDSMLYSKPDMKDIIGHMQQQDKKEEQSSTRKRPKLNPPKPAEVAPPAPPSSSSLRSAVVPSSVISDSEDEEQEVKAWKCNFCKASFKNKGRLTKHKNLECEGFAKARVWPCPNKGCDRMFTKQHVAVLHGASTACRFSLYHLQRFDTTPPSLPHRAGSAAEDDVPLEHEVPQEEEEEEEEDDGDTEVVKIRSSPTNPAIVVRFKKPQRDFFI